ncbi:hypothetical protein ACHAQJ_010414 [Trichoderma viride]
MISGDGATARAPAWKRLGLKLKQSSSAPEPANETLQVGHPSSSRTQQNQSTPSKRKPEAPPAGEPLSALKKSRNESHAAVSNPQLKKRKSVSFGETPTKSGIDTKGPADKPPPKKTKIPGKKKSNSAAAPSDIKPALEYLNQWDSARDSWKFNKNYQTILIKHTFDPSLFPAANIDTFYSYIRDLKGFVRTRLQETAMEIRTKDSTDGAAGFPEGSVNLPEKQLRYDQLLAQLLHSQAGQKRKTFHEVEYRTSSQDVDDVIRRVIKRMRAEMVLDQLSDGEETDASHTTTTTVSSGRISIADSNTTKTTEGDNRVKPNEGPSKRKRKLRTNVDDSSSSESESDSDDSSSSSDDSDSDSDGGIEVNQGHESDSSSSSSSSSSSESEDGSDSDDESADEE